MKTLITSLCVIICISFISISHFHWNNKTAPSSFVSAKDSIETESKAEIKNNKKTNISENLLEKTKNWPKNAQISFQESIENNNIYKIAIVGSPAMGGKHGWATNLKEELIQTYGESILQVQTFEYNKTSKGFIEEDHTEKIVNYDPDLILFEPFPLMDNGKVLVKDNHKNIEAFIEKLHKANKKVEIILQPAHPIYNATVYPTQIQDLKTFADENNITYLDHWSIWPDPNSEEIKDYLAEDQSEPSTKGHELWFNYLYQYFKAD